MKRKKWIMVLGMCLVFVFLVSTVIAQQGRGFGQRPKPPLLTALDSDNDGTISAVELGNAVAALKTLDKNGDGELTHNELRPNRGSRGDGAGRGGSEQQGRGQGEDRGSRGDRAGRDGSEQQGRGQGEDRGSRGDRAYRDGSGQQGQGQGQGRGQRMRPPLLRVLDGDGDHKISAAEINNAVNALKDLDSNGDGQLTRDEIRPKRRMQNER